MRLARYSQYAEFMSQARPIRPGTTYLITRRTERRHCLLRPDSSMNAFILYAFIVSAEQYGILIHAFCAMSTHVHYVVTDPLGYLPRFLTMFHQLVARGVKIIRQWDGAVWDRSQTSVVELCTRQAIVEKIAYTLANPVEAGLVWAAEEWPGVKTSVDDIGERALKAKRPEQYFRAENPQWLLDIERKVSLPPSIASTDAQTFRDDIRSELAKLEEAAHAEIPQHKVLGAERASEVSPESRITTHEAIRQLNPTFAVGRGNSEAFDIAKQALKDFRVAYRGALKKWREGDRSVVFPAGTYAMRVVHGANVDTAT
jgi:putative transposase